jgi:hypothetical protein
MGGGDKVTSPADLQLGRVDSIRGPVM